MRKGRAVILSDYVGGGSAASGGAGLAVMDSFRALLARGVDVRIIAAFGNDPGVPPGRFVPLDCEDLREGGISGAMGAIYNPRSRTALRDALADADPDRTVVILHQWTRGLSPSCVQLLGRFRLMVYMHDYFWCCPNGAYYDFNAEEMCHRKPLGVDCLTTDCDRKGRVQKLGRVARHVALRAVSQGPIRNRLFLSISQVAQRTVMPLLIGEQQAVVYNPLQFTPTQTANPDLHFDVGYFGRLEPEKGVALLLEAAGKLTITGLFVGEGRLEKDILGHPGMEHRPWQAHAQAGVTMRSCRIVVLPSLWPETWGLVVAEAMALGVQVLVSRRAGSAELVRRFGGGRMFDPGIVGDLEHQLSIMLRPDGLCAEAIPLDTAGLRKFLSPRRHADRLIALAAGTWGIDLLPAPPAPASFDERDE